MRSKKYLILGVTIFLGLSSVAIFLIMNQNLAIEDSEASNSADLEEAVAAWPASSDLVTLAAVGTNQQTCSDLSGPAVLVSSDLPTFLKKGEAFTGTLKILNCSKATWKKYNGSRGHNFGPVNPQENNTFGPTRYALPNDVAPGSSVDLQVTGTAPSTNGSYVFQLGLVKESVKWITPYLSPHIFIVGDYKTCDAARALVNTTQDAKQTIQTCIDAAPVGTAVVLPAGIYTVSGQVRVKNTISLVSEKSVSTRTAFTCDTEPYTNCAVIKAGATYRGAGTTEPEIAVLRVASENGGNVNNFTMVNVVIDGNITERLAASTGKCLAGVSRDFNISANSYGFKMFRSASVNAVCGTGLSLFGGTSTEGGGSVIAFNLFAKNGTHHQDDGNHGPWADGASIVGRNMYVFNNTFYNNTDVDLIFWYSKGSHIHYNRLNHDDQDYYSYATLMLTSNVNDPIGTDHSGTVISFNKIKCGRACGFGIVVGGKNWSPDATKSLGGTVKNNTIQGTYQAISVAGAGTAEAPVIISGNKFVNTRYIKNSCGETTTDLVFNPGSVVSHDLTSKVNSKGWNCTLPSCNFDQNFCAK